MIGWPQKDGWIDLYVETAIANGVHHLMHLQELPGLKKHSEVSGIEQYMACGGVMLFFTKHARDTVGYYNPKFKIYGHEHGDITHRCHRAGLHNGFGPYITPVGSREYLYSLDFELNNLGIYPEGVKLPEGAFVSSIHGEDVAKYVAENERYTGTGPIFQRLR